MKELVYLLILFVIIKEGSCACRIIPKALIDLGTFRKVASVLILIIRPIRLFRPFLSISPRRYSLRNNNAPARIDNIKGRCPMPEVAYAIPQYGMAVTVMEPYCERCECSRRGASCCSLYGKPTNIAKSCKIIYNNCKPKVVRKDDESVECPVYAMVG